MAIGERIRFFRHLRGLTQKDLGRKLGFPEGSADVRLAQYETGTRTPKGELTLELSRILEVSPRALTVPKTDTGLGLMHTFFSLEDLHGLEPELQNGEVVLKLDSVKGKTLIPMLADWARMRRDQQAGQMSQNDYDRWRYCYPEKP